MPREKATTEEENVEKNKVKARKGEGGALGQTPRKRVAPKKKVAAKKKTVTKKALKNKVNAEGKEDTLLGATKKTPRKRKPAAKKAVTKEVETEVGQVKALETSSVSVTKKTRKAPTAFAGEVAKKRAVKTQAIVMGVLMVVGVGASAAIGFTDPTAGQIDVAQTIKDRNARMANMVDVDGPTIVAPRQNANNAPNGGFVGARPSTASPAPVKPVATSTATSSQATASTTDDGAAIEEEPASTVPDTQASAMDTVTTTVTATPQNEEELE